MASVLMLATAAVWRLAWRAQRGAAARRRAGSLCPPAATERWTAPRWFAERLAAADVPVAAEQAWAALVASTVAAPAVAVVLAGPGLAVLAAALPPAAVAGILVARRDRADRHLDAAMPEALEAIARALRTGASLRSAVGEASMETPGRLGRDLRAVVAATDAGVPLVDALDAWAGRRPLPAIRLAVAALALGAETGGAQASAIDGVADTIRSRVAVAAEIRALSSQARLSGVVIALAPIAFALLATATDGRTADFLFRTPAGLACLTAGLVLDGVAGLWMHRLTTIRT